ncbi:SRPBCC family protein [Cesiribacter andamanensis]|uniref:Activator of Hsp90 ATPase homologue 1/2-like C-terminal domain-containing protein n=1 Tax=Cesiribacter andamanensis AMV16 TaxID=1279009 RepID=M7N1I7_9BACT|nr:SRPBCC domain-containing protein [Cesiribacter andamanensis]EMR02548.1 hypothetical protein ADICEAN_02300 [Cesiribacter andamanensis AMV16]
MRTAQLFEFTVDKNKNSILVTRAFAAPLALVWDAWTKAELLDQWWAPKPYRVETKAMDFREGGTWLYAMISPENEAHWCRADYQKIIPGHSFSGLDAFCDEEGNFTPDFPRSLWNNVFEGNDPHSTTVQITLQFDSLEDLEKIIAMGFKEGFTMGLENLDALLLRLNQ